MARGQKVAAAVAFFVHGLSAACAQDLFPTYRDENWEEEARNGVVSLTSTSGNYSVNLSGFLILGMTMSAAVTMWAYLQTALERTKNRRSSYNHGYNQGQGYSQPAYNQDYENEVYLKEAPKGPSQKQRLSPSSNSMNYTLNLSGFLMLGLGVAAATMFWAHASAVGRRKRSLDDEQEVSLPMMMAKIHSQFEDAEIRQAGCRQRVICETSSIKGLSSATFGNAIYNFFNSIENNNDLKFKMDEDKWAKIYFSAWNHGKQGIKPCKAVYSECSLTPEDINNVLNRSE